MIEYGKILIPYYAMTTGIKAQFGIIGKYKGSYTLQTLLAYEFKLLKPKNATIFNDFTVLYCPTNKLIKRIVRDGAIELVDLATNNTISKRAFYCPLCD